MTHKKLFPLEPDDAVIILKSDGTCEISLPQWEAKAIPDNILMGAAIVYALQNQDLCLLIQNHFIQQSSASSDLGAAPP